MNFQHILRDEAHPEGDASGGAAPVTSVVSTPAAVAPESTPAAAPASTPASAPAAAAPGSTGDAPPAEVQFPDDWRQKLAGGDAKRLKQLERITDIGKFAESYFNAQDKIRSGETSRGLPDNPTEEQVKAYREANNIPEKAQDYSLSLDEGLVLGEEDKRIMAGVFEVAHAANVPTEVLSQLTNAMMAGRDQEEHARQQQDGLDMQTADRQMRDAWGPDYEMNKGMVRNLLNGLPEAIRNDFASARLANGQAVFNSPEMLNFFADAARAINPAATVVPAGTGNPIQAIATRIAELEGRMGTKEWFQDKSAQKEYMDLINARTRMS